MNLQSYPWYISDWRNSEAVMEMNLAEKGLYRELLDHCWETGSLPADARLLTRIARCTGKEFTRCFPKVKEQFYEKDGRLWHRKIDEKREELKRWKDERAASGKKGADSRWHSSANGSANSSANGQPLGPECPSLIPTLPLETTKPSATHTQERTSGIEPQPKKPIACASSPRFPEFWERWPRKFGMDSAYAAWNSYVTVENEPLVFGCLERFLSSGDAARGAIPMAGPTNGKSGWLADCARDGWKCQWPSANGAQKILSPTAKLIAEAKERERKNGAN